MLSGELHDMGKACYSEIGGEQVIENIEAHIELYESSSIMDAIGMRATSMGASAGRPQDRAVKVGSSLSPQRASDLASTLASTGRFREDTSALLTLQGTRVDFTGAHTDQQRGNPFTGTTRGNSDDVLEFYVELMQRDHTFRRMGRASLPSFSPADSTAFMLLACVPPHARSPLRASEFAAHWAGALRRVTTGASLATSAGM